LFLGLLVSLTLTLIRHGNEVRKTQLSYYDLTEFEPDSEVMMVLADLIVY
jgi:hypothetical protein